MIASRRLRSSQDLAPTRRKRTAPSIYKKRVRGQEAAWRGQLLTARRTRTGVGGAARLLDTLPPPPALGLGTSWLLRSSHILVNQGRKGCWEDKIIFSHFCLLNILIFHSAKFCFLLHKKKRGKERHNRDNPLLYLHSYSISKVYFQRSKLFWGQELSG